MAEVFAIIILLIILIMYRCVSRPDWKTGPKIEYHRLVKKYGRPTYSNTGSNGIAIWKYPGPFKRIMVIDENVPHGSHCDYVYATIKYFIDPKDMVNVLKVSDSIMYDKLKEELTVRCNSIELCAATIVLVNNVNKGLIKNIDEQYRKDILRAIDDAESNLGIINDIKKNYEYKNMDYGQCSASIYKNSYDHNT